MSGASAYAQTDVERAQKLFERAEVHFNVGEFERALVQYKQAYKLNPLVGLIFNIGRCHQRLGQYERAIFQYRAYLEQLPDAPNRAEVERLIAESQAALDNPRPTTVPVYVHEEPRGRRGAHRAWFWSSAALGGALLITGAVTGALNLSMSSEYKDPATTVQRRRELKDTGETLGVVSVVTLSAGGALAAVTTVLGFYTEFGGSNRKAVSFTPLPGGATLGVGGSF